MNFQYESRGKKSITDSLGLEKGVSPPVIKYTAALEESWRNPGFADQWVGTDYPGPATRENKDMC